MPIDPSIPLAVRPLQLPNPLEIYQQVQQTQALNEQRQAMADERQMRAGLLQQQTAKLQRDAEREAAGGAALDELFSSYEPGKPLPTVAVGKLYRTYGPERTSAIVKGLADMGAADLTNADTLRKSMTTRLLAIEALPEDRRGAAWDIVTKDYVGRGVVKPEEVPTYSPETLQFFKNQLLTPDKRYDAEHPKPVEMQPGGVLVNPQTGATIASVPEKVQKPASVQEYEYAVSKGYKGTYEQYQNEDANRKRPVVNVGAGASSALDPDGIDYAATEYRVTGRMPALGMGNGAARAAIINAAAKQARELRQTPAMAVQRQYAMRADADALKKIQVLSTTAEAAEQKALGQADIIAELSAKVGRTSWPMINAALMAGKTEITGDADATQLANAISTFASEYGKIVEGSTGSVSGSSDSARHTATKLINAKMSQGTLTKVLDLMKREMALTMQGYDVTRNHITERMGGAPASAAVPAPAAAMPAVEEWVRDPKTGRMVKKGGG